MHFYFDVCTEEYLAVALEQAGYDVSRVRDHDALAPDEVILEEAFQQGKLLITRDKDFGDLTMLQMLPSAGVILLRLQGLTPDQKTARLMEVVMHHKAEFASAFTVITPERVRIRPLPPA